MALFFDRPWFDTKLNSFGLKRRAMAASVALSDEDVSLIFKDQMEVTSFHVSAWAILLSETQSEIAKRCGISTAVPAIQTDAQRIAALESRVALLEVQIRDLIRQPNAKS